MKNEIKNEIKIKKALITGASRGIGKAIAEELAKNGFDLYLVCQHRLKALEALAQTLVEKYKINIQCFACDVGNSQSVQELFHSISHVDVVINNAGISYVGLLQDMTDEDWNTTIQTNLNSVFYTSRAALPSMLRSGYGKIINISSVWGSQGASMEVAYSTTKGGINAFTKALAKELAPSNIQVNAIACGLIDTEMNGHLSEEDMEALIAEIPADRIGRPEEVAKLLLQIINAPDYLTGQIITLDGGWI